MSDGVEIERIVREVLAALSARATMTNGRSEGGDEERTETSNNQAGELTLEAPVISLRELEGKLRGVTILKVRQGAVVTPAVRDEIKARGVELRIVGRSDAAARVYQIAMAEHGDGGKLDKLAPQIKEIASEQIAGTNDLRQSLEGLKRAMWRRRVPGLLLTTAPAAALCLANRDHSVRAVAASQDVERDCRAIGANIVIVDSRASLFELKRICQRVAKLGWLAPPAEWRTILGGI